MIYFQPYETDKNKIITSAAQFLIISCDLKESVYKINKESDFYLSADPVLKNRMSSGFSKNS